MAARANQAPAKPVTIPVLIGSAAAAGYAVWEGYPGLALVWAGIIASAWMFQPAVFTGKKDSRGYPTPAHEGEQASMNKYRLWSDLKFKMIIPGRDWLPFQELPPKAQGKLPLAMRAVGLVAKLALQIPLSFVTAVWAGTAAYFIPVTDPYTAGFGHWINAGAAFITVVQIAASRRRSMVADDECPGARLDSLLELSAKSPGKVAALTVTGLMAGGAAATVASVLIPTFMPADIPAVPEAAIWILLMTGPPLALIAKPWIAIALEHWQAVVAARAEWTTRWMQLKQDPAPRLVDRREVGPAVIDTFEAPPGVGAMSFWTMGPKIGPTMGTASRFAVVSVENLDSNNQPVPGTRHPGRFEIVNWPSDQLPDITDPSTPKDVVFELARSALVWMADGIGAARPILADVHLLTVNTVPDTAPAPKAPVDAEALVESWKTPRKGEPAGDQDDDQDQGEAPAAPQSPAAWALTWYAPDGPPPVFIRQSGRGALSGIFNADVVIDHRAQGGAGCIYAGALMDPKTEFDPSVGVTAATMKNLEDEDVWDGRWIEVMKMGTNPPVMQSATASSGRLKNGVVINHMAFVTRQGMPPHDFFNFEPKMNTVLNAAPFVTMTGFPDPAKASQRHAQAFSLYWSSSPVPSRPDDLAPVRGSDGPKWVLAGRVNEAFKIARLADRPEVASVTCLTKEDSGRHIWKIDLHLHGGVTLAELRGAANKIKTHWGCQWLRIAHEQETGMVSIVAGARPGRVKLASPRHAEYLTKLEWDQIFLDSGVSGLGGVLPVLRRTGTLPKNEDVQAIEFDLPPGLDFTSFTGARAKMESNSGNAFVEPRKIKDKPNAVQMLVCEVNPMPEKAGYDWEHINVSKFIPFATGIEGEPIEYNFRLDPHLLIAGASGGGKSVLLQSLAFGALIRGYDLYIADPTKGGADFKFAEPYAKAFTDDVFTAAAMMKGIYAEVVRRKNLNKTHAVGNYRDLPEDVRPKHIVILLDEFTSLMNPDPEPKPSDDEEMEAEREAIMASNRAKTEIGVYTGKIAREARSAGVTLFLATQKLSAKMLDTIPGAGDLKVNLSRLLMGKATYGDKQSALRAPQDAPELGDAIPPGRGLFETTAGSAMAIQAWYDPEEQTALARKLVGVLEPLAPEDKLQLSQFMAKVHLRAGVIESAPAEPAIVDLGEIELEMNFDELDFDLLDEAPASDPAPRTDLRADTVMFIDVDGNIAPFNVDPAALVSGEMITVNVPGRDQISYNPETVERISAVPVRKVWCTDWDTDAAVHLGHLIPDAVETTPYAGDDSGWWKIDAILGWLRDHPEVRRIIWMDDLLMQEDVLLELPFLETAREALDTAGIESLLIVPESSVGISATEIDEVEAFAAAGPAAAQPPSITAETFVAPAVEAPVVEAPSVPAMEDVFVPAPAPRVLSPKQQESETEDLFAPAPKKKPARARAAVADDGEFTPVPKKTPKPKTAAADDVIFT